MANKHKKRCSTSLVIKEMRIKGTMRCHYTPTRVAKIKRLKITSIGEDVEEQSFYHCWWEYKMLQRRWKTAWWFLKTLTVSTT